MKKISKIFLGLALLFGSAAQADDLRVYFSNDSMNGFQLSDAYETHDMGLRYSNDSLWMDLNLAIVSPNMYIYRNQFREANRSYGELVSLTVGSNTWPGYFKVLAVGNFNLDAAQDFAPRTFGLQPVAKINDLVRMENQLHVGIGGEYSELEYLPQGSTIYGYLGTDRASLGFENEAPLYKFGKLDIIGHLGAEYVAYDRIVSAKPISAKHRKIIPKATIELQYPINDHLLLRISDDFSLPTIASDKSLFANFNASITYTWN